MVSQCNSLWSFVTMVAGQVCNLSIGLVPSKCKLKKKKKNVLLECLLVIINNYYLFAQIVCFKIFSSSFSLFYTSTKCADHKRHNSDFETKGSLSMFKCKLSVIFLFVCCCCFLFSILFFLMLFSCGHAISHIQIFFFNFLQVSNLVF